MITEDVYYRLPVFKLNWRDRSRLKRAYNYIRDDGYLTSLPLALEMIDPTIPFFRTSNSTIRKVNRELDGRLLTSITQSTDTSYAAKRERSLAWIQKLLAEDRGIVFPRMETGFSIKVWNAYPTFNTTSYERLVLRRVRSDMAKDPYALDDIEELVREFSFSGHLQKKIRASLKGCDSLFSYLSFNSEFTPSVPYNAHNIEWINKLLLDNAPFERETCEPPTRISS